MTPRDAFLEHVRRAVVDGNRAGMAVALPDRRGLGHQGAAPDSVARFCNELRSAGGHPHVAADSDAAWLIIREVIEAKKARKIMIGEGGVIARLGLAGRLRSSGFDVTTVADLSSASARDVFFGADVGISNVAQLIAETGSVVMATGPGEPRALSLLPPVHIAVADPGQLLDDLFDLFDLFSPLARPEKLPPSCLTLITGPSKTGDIELKLVTGVHGPGEIHVVLCMR